MRFLTGLPCSDLGCSSSCPGIRSRGGCGAQRGANCGLLEPLPGDLIDPHLELRVQVLGVRKADLPVGPGALPAAILEVPPSRFSDVVLGYIKSLRHFGDEEFSHILLEPICWSLTRTPTRRLSQVRQVHHGAMKEIVQMAWLDRLFLDILQPIEICSEFKASLGEGY